MGEGQNEMIPNQGIYVSRFYDCQGFGSFSNILIEL